MPKHAEQYLQKSGDKEILAELPLLEFEESWFNYLITDDRLTIFQAYGNHLAIEHRAHMLAQELKLPYIRYATTNKGKASARLFGGKIIGHIIEVKTWAQ